LHKSTINWTCVVDLMDLMAVPAIRISKHKMLDDPTKDDKEC